MGKLYLVVPLTMHFMETLENYKMTTIDKLTDSLVKMLDIIRTYPNSHLSYNLTLLAAMTDATHLRKVMEVMLNNWSKSLPFIGEEGVDTNWNLIKERIWKAQVMIDKEKHHPMKTNIPSPLPEGIEEWSDWQSLILNGENKVNSPLYKKELNPIEQNNLSYFVSFDFDISNNMPNGSTNYMRVFLRHMTAKENPQLKNLFCYEMERIQQLADNLRMLLYDPTRIILPQNEQDSLINDFLSRLIKDVFHFKIDLKMGEYRNWYKDLQHKMDEEMLLRKKVSLWNDVVESGFLEPLTMESPQKKGEDNYMSHFFKNNQLETRIAGCYIYRNQVKCADWNRKVEKFLFFVAVSQQIEKDISELPQERRMERKNNIQSSVSTSDLQRKKIATCIRLLMKEKDTDNPKLELFRLKNQWIAIHRVLSSYYGFAKGYTEFYEQTKELGLEDIKYPCTLDGVMRTPLKVLDKPIEEWKKYKDKKYPCEKVFLKQYHVAIRLLKILEEQGVNKVVNE